MHKALRVPNRKNPGKRHLSQRQTRNYSRKVQRVNKKQRMHAVLYCSIANPMALPLESVRPLPAAGLDVESREQAPCFAWHPPSNRRSPEQNCHGRAHCAQKKFARVFPVPPRGNGPSKEVSFPAVTRSPRRAQRSHSQPSRPPRLSKATRVPPELPKLSRTESRKLSRVRGQFSDVPRSTALRAKARAL